MMFFLNVDEILSHQKDIRKNMITQIKKKIDRKGIYVPLVLTNLPIFLEVDQSE